MTKIKNFINNEAVLIISLLLMIGSIFFVPVSKQYIDYIDFKTLALLFCLMAVTSSLKECGVFENLSKKLIKSANTSRKLYIVLVLLCFLFSMIITNDVALITFVPFTLITLKMSSQSKRAIFFISSLTVAANLGSMITPIGNPQNLYLFSKFNMTLSDFLKPIFPYWVLSLILLMIMGIFAGNEKITINDSKTELKDKKKIITYIILFLITLLCVFRFIPYYIVLAAAVIYMLIFDRNNLKRIDHSLIFTFVFLFIFIGNLGNIQSIAQYFKEIIDTNETEVGILASQIFSNVPACILLSGFTDNSSALLIGVNLGGLGTLIASMASLISFKFIKKEGINTKKYLTIFTVINIVFLALNYLLYIIIK